MKRFMGMMPSSEITIEKRYKDKSKLPVLIQAGPHGWTIIYADGGTNFKDVDAEDKINFKSAYDEAVSHLGTLTPVVIKGEGEKK